MEECIFVTYRDGLGYVTIAVSKYGVSFSDGYAVFEDCESGKEYKIPVNNLFEITACDW